MKINAFPLFCWTREEGYWSYTIGLWPLYVQVGSVGGRCLVACFLPRKAYPLFYF